MNIRFKAIVVFCLAGLGASRLCAALPGTESLVKLIVKEYDTNTDGVIDSGEWQNGMGESFAKLDSNGDGSLQAEDVDALTGDIAGEVGDAAAGITVALIKQILLAFDSDGDKLVSRKEYTASVTELFTKLDTDKGNSVSVAELAELPVKLLAK